MKCLEGLIKGIGFQNIQFFATDARRIYAASFEGGFVYFRLNDFPDEPLCTFMGAGDAVDLESYDYPEKSRDRLVDADSSFGALFDLQEQSITWRVTGTADIAQSTSEGTDIYFRINDWPEPKCTVVGFGNAIDLDEVPEGWSVAESKD